MGTVRHKLRRYHNLIKRIVNWRGYLRCKMTGIGESFTFQIRDFGPITVPRGMLGPFRENFLDDVYFRHIPEAKLSGRNPVILDIGANVGFFSLAAFARYPGARVHAFEPHPFCYEFLGRFRQKFKRCEWNIYNQAVGDRDGTVVLHTRDAKSFSTKATIKPDDDKSISLEVSAKRLDTFLRQEKLSRVDLVKMDCEGAEYSILYNLPRAEFKRINAFSIETHRGQGARENTHALSGHLRQSGYLTKVTSSNKDTGYIWAWRG